MDDVRLLSNSSRLTFPSRIRGEALTIQPFTVRVPLRVRPFRSGWRGPDRHAGRR
jgi:hypothetical protein